MWELAVAIGIPGVGALAVLIRYLHKKALCFTIMQNKINTLSDHDEGSDSFHQKIDGRMNNFELRQAKNEIFLKLLLDERKIPYN